MTTIAWDGRTIAADRRRTTSTGLIGTFCKLFTSDGWIVAPCGDLPLCQELVAWILAGMRPETRPTLEDSVHALLIERATGRPLFIEGKRPFPYEVLDPYRAIGSGQDFAMAAMACGKSAREAVLLAAEFDCFTGNGVDVIDVPTWPHSPSDP